MWLLENLKVYMQLALYFQWTVLCYIPPQMSGEFWFVHVCDYAGVFIITVFLGGDIIHVLEMYPFKGYDPVVFSLFTELYNHHYQIIEHLYHPRKKHCTHYQSLLISMSSSP